MAEEEPMANDQSEQDRKIKKLKARIRDLEDQTDCKWNLYQVDEFTDGLDKRVAKLEGSKTDWHGWIAAIVIVALFLGSFVAGTFLADDMPWNDTVMDKPFSFDRLEDMELYVRNLEREYGSARSQLGLWRERARDALQVTQSRKDIKLQMWDGSTLYLPAKNITVSGCLFDSSGDPNGPWSEDFKAKLPNEQSITIKGDDAIDISGLHFVPSEGE